ncbi:hypothetical protein BRADI_4g04987v3 [Brachypodium distachyon]|uniref:Terpene synthase n=1 Tax=Brachypodium distachyon TaxID=15368 RepID=A0A2K2CKK9_BRADI|nr:hypothetical protein BRADI_4g04987v3 [Brachypodium distachyon]
MASRGIATPAGKESSFEPSLWGDFFLTYEPQTLQRTDEWMRERTEKLKEDVRRLFKSCNGTGERMLLVDVLQHLGIDHHFDEQIDSAVSEILGSEFSSSSLHEVSLRFRLLREHGHWVSPDVFNKFKGKDGSFNKETTNDPRGLLSLYNAAHLLVHDEPALEEAIAFTRQHLQSMRGRLMSPLAEQVKRALQLPLPRTYVRVEAVCYISEYEEEEGHNPILLELAKWWKELSGFIGLSYVRDRLVECYLWALVPHCEESFALPRIIFAKANVLLTVMDDTYDMHATIEECRQLHEAVQRWDESATSVLPEYLRKFYNEVLRNIKEIGDEMAMNGNYEIAYIKKQLQKQFTYYLQDAEWIHQNHKPSFEIR